jgi:hypothetical protein
MSALSSTAIARPQKSNSATAAPSGSPIRGQQHRRQADLEREADDLQELRVQANDQAQGRGERGGYVIHRGDALARQDYVWRSPVGATTTAINSILT